MPTPVLNSDELAMLRSFAARGDKVADVLIRMFDTGRANNNELTLARAATTANRTLSGLTSTNLDGITPIADDVILVKGQTDPKDNGLYYASAGSWTRVTDDQGSSVLRPGMLVQIREGTTLQDTQWTCTSNATVIGTDNIVFGQMATSAVATGSLVPGQLNESANFAKSEDFPLAAGGTLPAPLAKDLNNSATGDYLNDTVGGVYSLETAAVSEAEDAQLTFGNQNILDPSQGLVFEARVRVTFPGAAVTADERWVVGLCSDHTNSEDSLDNTTYNAWFRGEGANLNIYIEGDDAVTDTDDTDSTIDYVKNAWMVLKIDMTSLAAVKFFVNGVQVGTTVNLSALDGTKVLQPIFCYQRDAGTEINKLQVDWFRVYQGRA
jgi:hypothetical protein